MRRISTPLLLALLLALPGRASGAEIRGYIKLDPKFALTPIFDAPGYWLLPNDTLEIQPPHVDPRMEMVVELKGSGLPTKELVKPQIHIDDARLSPTVLPVKANTKIAFVNQDAIPHIFETVGSSLLHSKRVGINESFQHAFEKPGVYRVRSTEVPHMVVEILVSDAPLATLPDASGVFTIPDIPAGSYTLRIWYRGKWIYNQAVAAQGRTRVDILLTKPAGKD
jgi:plastocyanin